VTQRSLTLWLWSLVLVVGCVLLLLHNFLLLDFDVLQLWPLLLVVLGLQVLVRGDLGLSCETQHFGITRGSVEQATLRANSGELDMRVGALQRTGRLIAGQYTARSRPALQVNGNSATLTMLRGKTWLLSLANWDLNLATDVPWNLLLSTYLGEIEADLRGVIIGQARIATGFGDIHLMGPDNPAGPITAHSTLGYIYLAVPETMEAAVTVSGGPMFDVHVKGERWRQHDADRYVTLGYHEAIEPLDFTVSGTFGDLILS
jgi:hypothetical protein